MRYVIWFMSVLLCLFTLGCSRDSSSHESSNRTKTFTNKQIGYRIEYPSSWHYYEPERVVPQPPAAVRFRSPEGAVLVIEAWEEDGAGRALSGWKHESITLARGATATQYTIPDGVKAEAFVRRTFLRHGQYLINLDLHLPPDWQGDRQRLYQEFDSILRTFHSL